LYVTKISVLNLVVIKLTSGEDPNQFGEERLLKTGSYSCRNWWQQPFPVAEAKESRIRYSRRATLTSDKH